MPRLPFDTTADFYEGPNGDNPNAYVGSCNVRFVPCDGINNHGVGAPTYVGWLTCEDIEPKAGWGDPVFSLMPSRAYQVAIPHLSAKAFWVLWVERIDWRLQTPYYRAMLVELPLPEECDCYEEPPPEEPIQTPCCPEPIPATLHLQTSCITCQCWNVDSPIYYDVNYAGHAWFVLVTVNGHSILFQIECVTGGFEVTITCDGFLVLQSEAVEAAACVPFSFQADVDTEANHDACGCGNPGPHTIHVSVTSF